MLVNDVATSRDSGHGPVRNLSDELDDGRVAIGNNVYKRVVVLVVVSSTKSLQKQKKIATKP